MTMSRAALWAALLLAACGGSTGHWVKNGADEEATAREYRDCRAQAGQALATDRGVDQDILASRGRDWQQAHTLAGQSERMGDQAAGRADAILDACMRAKGFVKEG
jgi:hypothetical protein